jgi:purine-binding chemotaxis protein CheW
MQQQANMVAGGRAGGVPMALAGRVDEDAAAQVFLTLTVADTLCGVPVLSVRDVLTAQAITRIPLAPAEVAGSLNLRGRIVTAIDLRRRLGLPPRAGDAAGMSVVVERDGELYSLLVDEVGDVVPLPRTGRAAKPPTLDPLWREVAADVHRLEDRLVILLDVERVLAIGA